MQITSSKMMSDLCNETHCQCLFPDLRKVHKHFLVSFYYHSEGKSKCHNLQLSKYCENKISLSSIRLIVVLEIYSL